MATTIAQIRAGLVTRLQTITGLNTYSAEPGTITPPAAVVVTPTIDFHRSFNSDLALKSYTFRIMVLVAQGLLDQAAHTLDTFADPGSATSVRAAIEGDQTLGGVAESLIVESFRPLNAEEVASLQYWGGEFSVTVYAR
jgi:hypothetical protein